MRRVGRWLRPPGRVPLGPPEAHARLARWGRWYGWSALSLFVVGAVLVVLGQLTVAYWSFGLSLTLAYSALGAWRVKHPPAGQ